MNEKSHTRRRRTTLSIGEIATELVTPLDSTEYRPITRLRLAWADICGVTLNAHTVPRAIRGDVLIIETTSEEWADAIVNIQASLLRKCRPLAPDIAHLETITTATPVAHTAAHAHQPTSRVATDDISHEGLRTAMNGLLDARDARTEKGKPS
ncbi:MAG: DciA family protein [Myxococcota bacterium]|nr:DciA family protein [Myxococcota bacterium]